MPETPVLAGINEASRGVARIGETVLISLAEIAGAAVDFVAIGTQAGTMAAFGWEFEREPWSVYGEFEGGTLTEQMANRGTDVFRSVLFIDYANAAYKYAIDPSPENIDSFQRNTAIFIPFLGLRGPKPLAGRAAPVEGAAGPTIRFGNNPNQSYHTFRHVVAARMDEAAVQAAIQADLAANAALIKAGLNVRTVAVAGQHITYHAFQLPDGVVNVGRITLP